MRLVHLADLHLGFRQYQRVAPGGQNQREADIARTFAQTVDRVIALRPDLIVVAGDVFHHPRPTNSAILLAFAQFSRLREALPNTPIIVAAGNHDTPRTIDTGGILQLLAPLGVQPTGSQILPLVLGKEQRALEVAGLLREAGFDVRAIRPPTVRG